jgi:hypothetical protein
MSSDHLVIDAIRVAKLYLDTTAQWRKHLGEDDLLVPDGFVATTTNRCPSLHTQKMVYMQWSHWVAEYFGARSLVKKTPKILDFIDTTERIYRVTYATVELL